MAHIREHDSFLAAAEKRALIYIAVRLPRRINSDHLSALGLISMAGAGAAFAGLRFTPWAALAVVACLVANWFGDSLDGTVARVRNQQRPNYGFYVDHVIDVAGSAFLLIGLAGSGLMSPIIALGLLVAYLIVSAETYLATHARGVFRMSFLGFGPTELRILLAGGAIKAAMTPFIDVPVLGPTLMFDLGGAIGALGLIVAFAANAARNTRALYLAEPIPQLGRQVQNISGDSARSADSANSASSALVLS
jgi:archaetidylinositol phosphate synthase